MAEQTTLNFGTQAKGPVTCLGMTFENDAARREYFTKLLAEKLKDPEFRKIEGFPVGKDEDILALSDPPYYCACPNPWINDFISEWEAAKPPKPMGYKYEREPFAADVSEGKNDPIYNAHSYHTKVPHKAIMRYILHYTEPGDIVFDGFCGTGMTGVAAQMCGNIEQVRSLGYIVDEKTGEIRDPAGDDPKRVISRLGARRAVLNDLSPAASFIAYNYNTPFDQLDFESVKCSILDKVEDEYGWMFTTKHVDTNGRGVKGPDGNDILGRINHFLVSDVFCCPHCMKDIIFYDVAFDGKGQCIREVFKCPHCKVDLTKKSVQKKWVTEVDPSTGELIKTASQKIVRIIYTIPGKKSRFEKSPDNFDNRTYEKIKQTIVDLRDYIPSSELPDGFNTRQPKQSHGVTHTHQFYLAQSLCELVSIWQAAKHLNSRSGRLLMFAHTAASPYVSKMRRFRPDKKGGGPLAGTLYIPSIATPPNPVVTIDRNAGFIANGLATMRSNAKNLALSIQGSQNMKTIPRESQDYIFLDPPFGANINYSELNFLWESWLGVFTNNKVEAIENDVQCKGVFEYRNLIQQCFAEAYRILKPGRWMTVEFSNTSASVWNSIQSALSDVGFIVASVSALNKKQGSFKAVTTPTAVKQDLVITAYKPDTNFEARFKIEGETESGVWDFVRTHLGKLPTYKIRNHEFRKIQERDPRILFDQVISFFVRRNLNVPISAKEFQLGLAQKFSERDGLYFLPEQVADYDKKKSKAELVESQGELFVCDEASAIVWLRARLKEKPQTYASINPDFMQQLNAWNKHETLPELRLLLDENFLCYDGRGPVPSQIHGYLSNAYHDLRMLGKDDPKLVAKATDLWYVPDPNSAADMEKKREKALLKEFESYRAEKKLKKFRLEVVRAGFKKAFTENDFATILAIGEKIPEDVINEDNKLLMWYNIAQRLGGK